MKFLTLKQILTTKKNIFLIFGFSCLIFFVNHSVEGIQFDSLEESNPNFAYHVLTEKKCGENKPLTYGLGTKILRVSTIDRENGTFDLKFAIWLTTGINGVDFTKTPPPLDFINAQQMTIIINETKPTFYNALVEGTFHNDFDFKNYPFEKLDLILQIEPLGYEECERIFLVDTSAHTGFDYEIGESISGYKIVSFGTNASIVEYTTGQISENYARVTTSIQVEAPFAETFLQYVFPVFLLSFLAIMVYYITKDPFQKIELNALFLVSMVFYSQLVKFQNTFITDFTIFDGIVSISYGIFLITIIISGIQLRRAKKAEA